MSRSSGPPHAPALTGFTYQGLLGVGGYSSVFLYLQGFPRRRVAVKVLEIGLAGSDAVQQFRAEANILAELSAHPSIVTIYEAGTAADGRPYIAMEYCPGKSLWSRAGLTSPDISAAIATGVGIAGAVESAHRAGVLHGDIKPANLLVTSVGRPVLADFGVASNIDEATNSQFAMSIPWAAPETFGDFSGRGVASDVWSLGATVYSLASGRTPFASASERVGYREMLDRIAHAIYTPLAGTEGKTAHLDPVLSKAMAKRPDHRFRSALEFGEALQAVEVELKLARTELVVLEAAPVRAFAGDRRFVSAPPPPAAPAPEDPWLNSPTVLTPSRHLSPPSGGNQVPLDLVDGHTVMSLRSALAEMSTSLSGEVELGPTISRVSLDTAVRIDSEVILRRRVALLQRGVPLGLIAFAGMVTLSSMIWVWGRESEPGTAGATIASLTLPSLIAVSFLTMARAVTQLRWLATHRRRSNETFGGMLALRSVSAQAHYVAAIDRVAEGGAAPFPSPSRVSTQIGGTGYA